MYYDHTSILRFNSARSSVYRSYNIEVPIDTHCNTNLVDECLNSCGEKYYCVCHNYNILQEFTVWPRYNTSKSLGRRRKVPNLIIVYVPSM